MRSLLVMVLVAACSVASPCQDGYRRPPQAIVDAATAPPPPMVSTSPTREHLVLVHRDAMPSIAVLSRPVSKLAGVRFDPRTYGPQRTGGRRFGYTLVSVADGGKRAIEVPDDADLGWPIWAADGQRFAFTNTVDDRIELWLADVRTAKARRIAGLMLADVVGTAVRWLPDQRRLLCQIRTGGEPPAAPDVPVGPIVQESVGKTAPVRTYQDLLTDEHDADLFEFYGRSQLAVLDPESGDVERIGAPAIHAGAAPSPDGRHLLVTRIVRPFSYLVTAWSFPREIEVVDLEGRVVRTIAKLPLADEVPIGGVPEGPRTIEWIPTEPSTLVWAEALDGGDPKAEVPHRDRVMFVAVPSEAEPIKWFRTEYRFTGISFGERGELAFANTYDRDRRWTRTWRVWPRERRKAPELWHERAARDAYGDPGRPVQRENAAGFAVIRHDGDTIFLAGDGASPEGDRPFLDRVDLETGEKQRLFHCAPHRLEEVAAMLDERGEALIVRRESVTEPPNWFVTTDGGRTYARNLTGFVDAQAELTRGIRKELLVYEREDGVTLSGTLYTPPGFEQGTRVPLLVWAYPREFVSTDTAGQVRGSPHRYVRLSGTSPLMVLLAGYAVLDDAAMPVVGPQETANDTFVEQLVAGARAAIDVAVAKGVADPERCAIAGHSYGAFMTANLLAHSDLFQAGIARSGAYNRTLTPFGFQNERRTFWEAPDIYFAMSPFMHAPKIDEPLLLIHGEADNNSGTFPIQSRRLYHAIQGSGGHVRLVMLPEESHGYRAEESVLHVLAETIDWLDRHVKNAGSAVSPAGDR